MHRVSLSLTAEPFCCGSPVLTSRRALSGECQQAGLNVYVTNDGADIYEDRFRQTAAGGSGGTDTIQPTLILLGVRLGIDRVTPVYREALKCILKYPQSVGIAGYVEPTRHRHPVDPF